MNKILSLLAAAFVAAALAGCGTVAPFHKNAEVPKGPETQVVFTVEDALACVASRMKPRERSRTFGVLDFPDLSGAENRVGNDGFGTFNTQGAASMLASSLRNAGVGLVELGPSFRNVVDWNSGTRTALSNHSQVVTLQKKSVDGEERSEQIVRTRLNNVIFPEVGLYGSITTTDFMPGGGASGGAFGVNAGYQQNRALTSVDLRAVVMPKGNRPGGRVIASTTVKKQIVQDGVRVSLSRYMALGGTKTLFEADGGFGRREPMKYSTREMIDVATADVLAQIFGINGCTTPEAPRQKTKVAGVDK